MIILRQSEYASRDYAGLDARAAADLREDRNDEAKLLWQKRKKINEHLATRQDYLDKDLDAYYRALPKFNAGDKHAFKKEGVQNEAITQSFDTHDDIKKYILNERKEMYQDAQNRAKSEAQWDRNSVLRDTQRRADSAAEAAKLAQEEQERAQRKAQSSLLNSTTTTQPKPGMSTGGKVALGVAGAGALAAAGYGIYRHFQNKKKKKQEKELQ